VGALAIGALLAVAASLLLNGSYLMQHAGSQHAPAVDARRPLATLRGLLGSRWWLVGAVAGMTGWGLHIAALFHAPLSLVQAVVAGGLALTVPAAALTLGERLDRRGRLAIAGMVAGLIALGAGATAGHATAAAPVRAVAFLLGTAALAGLLAGVRAGAGRSRALAVAGGLLYGAGDAAMKGATLALQHGGGMLAAAVWVAAALAASGGAFLAFQRGLQLGPAVPVVALMTAATNVVAVLGGLVVFGDVLGLTPALAALHAAGFVAIIVAGLPLAAAQARIGERRASGSAPSRWTVPAPPPAPRTPAGA
jgi:drug/metabolite transporter (DMT)-like permease